MRLQRPAAGLPTLGALDLQVQGTRRTCCLSVRHVRTSVSTPRTPLRQDHKPCSSRYALAIAQPCSDRLSSLPWSNSNCCNPAYFTTLNFPHSASCPITFTSSWPASPI